MVIETEKYIRKPLYVQAVQITSENFAEALTWCNGDLFTQVFNPDTKEVLYEEVPSGTEASSENHFIRIRVHNPQSPRQTRAFVGDWILYTDKGYKIYTDKAFRENFDIAPITL